MARNQPDKLDSKSFETAPPIANEQEEVELFVKWFKTVYKTRKGEPPENRTIKTYKYELTKNYKKLNHSFWSIIKDYINSNNSLIYCRKAEDINELKNLVKQHLGDEHNSIRSPLERYKEFLQWRTKNDSIPEDDNSDDCFDITVASKPKRKKGQINTILYGPPGTGKTYNTVTRAVEICGENYEDYSEALAKFNELKNNGRVRFTTFHQSYGYEEFIEGIKPVLSLKGPDTNSGESNTADSEASKDPDTNSGEANTADSEAPKDLAYRIEPGVFKEFCDRARDHLDKNYVFIIDEINRGNISKVFGELITLIEESKREDNPEAASARLPYSGEEFSVPRNVYILGTMNTADRSIAIMDTALRRRFHFVEMMPDPTVLEDVAVEAGGKKVDVSELLETINRRIECLYDREHTIGHAYFMGVKNAVGDKKLDELADVFRNKVIPLLQEYFYEDYAKIQMVLGDNAKKNDDFKFIREENLAYKKVFLGDNDAEIDLPEKTYSVNEEAFKHIESYTQIVKAETSNEGKDKS